MCAREQNRIQRGKSSIEVNRERWRIQAAKFRAQHPERARALQRKSVYGITQEQYEDLVKQQEGLCAICGDPPSGQGRSGQSLHIDHDHETGSIRGLLCQLCNLALGGFRDEPKLLRKAIEYLA